MRQRVTHAFMPNSSRYPAPLRKLIAWDELRESAYPLFVISVSPCFTGVEHDPRLRGPALENSLHPVELRMRSEELLRVEGLAAGCTPPRGERHLPCHLRINGLAVDSPTGCERGAQAVGFEFQFVVAHRWIAHQDAPD